MYIGNDAMIWLMAKELEKVWFISDHFSKCRYWPGSTTAADEKRLSSMYSELKRRVGKSCNDVEIYCHAYKGLNPSGLYENLERNQPKRRVNFIHPPGVKVPKTEKSILIPDYESLVPQKTHPADSYWRHYFPANCAFCEAAVMSKASNSDVLYIEGDCRFKGQWWDEVMVQEHIGNGPRCLVSGSLVLWSVVGRNDSKGLPFFKAAAKYTNDTGFVPAIEAIGGSLTGEIAFTNGALSIFSRRLLDISYASKVSGSSSIQSFCDGQPPYDIHIGISMRDEFSDDYISRIGWMRSVYSGCLDHHYTLGERLKMLESGQVVAVHQVK
jgi:hypothetical protein